MNMINIHLPAQVNLLSSDKKPSTFTGVTTGAHSGTVTDSHGCQASWSITVGPDAITINTSTTPPSCHDGYDGTITITVAGGTPDEYGRYDIYLSSDGGTTYTDYGWQNSPYTITGLEAGTYTIKMMKIIA